jgi:lipopolysaccharide/colanic/teichoic acid biosynthesis glycosyltransferase
LEYGGLGFRSVARAGDRAGSTYRLAKRLFDVAAALIALLVLLPLFVVIAIAIKLGSPGPIVLRQRRVGYLGHDLQILKFRTMLADRRQVVQGVPPSVGERRRRHKSPRDPRVTQVGRFLRRTSLDELPQLWNILRGEMSLVGPRPELPEIVARYEPWQHTRHQVMPGLTGWWQINRDGRTLMCEATELDLYYVEHCSMTLDLLILLRTAGALLRGTGAY